MKVQTCRDIEGIVHGAYDHYRARTFCGMQRAGGMRGVQVTFLAFSKRPEQITCLQCLAETPE